MPESAATLNNASIVCTNLFGVTGDLEVLDRGVRMLEKAFALAPRNSILVANHASTSLSVALRGLLTDRINLKVLRREADFDLFSYLYADAVGRKAVAERMRTSTAVARTRPHFDNALLSSPRN